MIQKCEVVERVNARQPLDRSSEATGTRPYLMFITYRYRVKDSTVRRELERQARAVNFVWNYCGEIQEAAWRQNKKWPTRWDFGYLTAGSSRLMGLHSCTISEVCHQFVVSRNKIKRRPRWRGNRALGWVPFSHGHPFKLMNGGVLVYGKHYPLWYSRPIKGKIKSGNFSADARGRWYLNLQCQIETENSCGEGQVGIDLGLTNVATLSDGTTVPALQHYRRYEEAIKTAFKAKKRKRVLAINAKIANSRRHHLHVQTTKIVDNNSFIAVGKIEPMRLVKSKMAKSIMDASWSMFSAFLRYKAIGRGATYVVVDERWSSQLCSTCGTKPASRPRGIAQLGMRSWKCDDCGTVHDRDVNAAINILNFGRECPPLAAGIQGSETLTRSRRLNKTPIM
jgi:putative transposase